MNSTPLAMNTGDHERWLLQNMGQIRAESFVYSSLIDVLEFDYYNIVMQDNSVINLIDMEIAKPKRKLNYSVGAVYGILIILMVGVISLTNLIVSQWEISRVLVQLTLYLCVGLIAGYVYRFHYITFRYTLTDQIFAIERIAGNDQKTIASIFLEDICDIGSTRTGFKRRSRIINTSVISKQKSIWVTIAESDMRLICYRVNLSQEFLNKLLSQWQIAKAQKET